MSDGVIVVGAGGFGRETLDVIEAANAEGAALRIVGVVDTAPKDVDLNRLAARGVSYLGTEDEWLSGPTTNARFVVAIGNPTVREMVTHRMTGAGLLPFTVIHPRAVVGSGATIGDGVVICAGVQVSTNVVLGDHVHLNPSCIVGHDSVLDSFVSVNPGAIVSGNVHIESNALLGASSVVLQGLNVGSGSTVGAGACVTKNVTASSTVVGIPARAMQGRSS